MSNFEFPHTRTYDSDLGWLIKCCKTVQETIKSLEDWKAEVNPTIEDFKKLYDMMMSGNLPPGIQEGIRKWLSMNAIDLIGELVKTVFFGLTDDGHFVAYIPDSWDDITFNTSGYDIDLADHPEVIFGHLILSY